jgi:hypothetical protein
MDGPANSARSAILAGANLAFLIAIGHLYWSLDSLRGDLMALRQSVVAEIAKMRVTAAPAERKALSAADVKRLEDLRRDLETQLSAAKGQAVAAARSAKVEAVSHADQIARKLGDEQETKHHEVTAQLGEVKQNTNAKLDSVSTELSEVKNQVASTRFELERTISDLKRVTGDLGVQSGLIATNAQELAVLKALGERNYYDFHLERGRHPQRVGDVSLVLKRDRPEGEPLLAGNHRGGPQNRQERPHDQRTGAVLRFALQAALRDRGQRGPEGFCFGLSLHAESAGRAQQQLSQITQSRRAAPWRAKRRTTSNVGKGHSRAR